VLHMPARAGDDAALLVDIGERVMQIQFDAEALVGDGRDRAVIEAMKAYEADFRS
jgi:hypothetical protein